MARQDLADIMQEVYDECAENNKAANQVTYVMGLLLEALKVDPALTLIDSDLIRFTEANHNDLVALNSLLTQLNQKAETTNTRLNNIYTRQNNVSTAISLDILNLSASIASALEAQTSSINAKLNTIIANQTA